MSQETAFLLHKMRDLSNQFYALSDAIITFETSPDLCKNENAFLVLQKMKVQLCEVMLQLNDIFDSTVYNWSQELEKSEV